MCIIWCANKRKLHVSAYSRNHQVLTTFQMLQAYAHIAKSWRQKTPRREQEVPKTKEKMS